MPYNIELMGDNRTILTKFRGIIDNSTAKDFEVDVKTFLELDAKTYFFLLDFSEASMVSDNAREGLIKLAHKIHNFAKRFAVIARADIKGILMHMFEGAGGLTSVRIFDDQQEAIQWLWGE